MSDCEYVRLSLRLLDEQLVDCEGARVGRVEDLEFGVESEGGPPTVTTIVTGKPVWRRRLPDRAADLLPDDPSGQLRIGWQHVACAGNEIELRTPIKALETSGGDSREREGRLTEMLGLRAVTASGRRLGRVHDLVGRRPADSDAHVPWHVHGVLVGRKAALHRFGRAPRLEDEMSDGAMPPTFVAWARVRGLDDDGHLVVEDE